MAIENDDIIGQLLQEVFKERDGLKNLLEMLLNYAMCTELADQLRADPYQRTDTRRGHRNGHKSRTIASIVIFRN